jgi:Tfp pilus assembly protein PilF
MMGSAMTDPRVDALRAQIGGPRDGALLRFALAQALHAAGEAAAAIVELEAALGFDPGYSAAWKALGAALTDAGRRDEARTAYERGVAAAERRGDVQAAREMRVFAKRLQKNL